MPNLNHATDIGAPALESNRFGGANELRNHGVTRDRHCRGRGSFVEIPVSVGQTVAKGSNISGVDRTLSPPNPLFEFVRWRLRRPWKIAAFRILADAGLLPLNLFRPGNPIRETAFARRSAVPVAPAKPNSSLPQTCS